MSNPTSHGESLLANDLDHILAHTRNLWEDLRGQRLFITGGTGFFGGWLLESLLWANARLDLDVSAVILTRDVETFRKLAPHLAAQPALQFQTGNVRNFDFPSGEFSHIIHAATTAARATFYKTENSLVKFDTVVEGTRRVLDFAVQCCARNFLLTSTGLVYGKQPAALTHLVEAYGGAPDPANFDAVVGLGKRVAEFLCAFYADQFGLATKIARCFTFVGPYLPLDIHYAIGNFIRDGINHRPIVVKGDGSAVRSYLYAADLVIWLWTIFLRGQVARPYNVGSEDGVEIRALAEIVAQEFQPPLPVQVMQPRALDRPVDRYVPSTQRAQSELGLRQTISLREAIQRTIEWNVRVGQRGAR